MPRDIPVGNGDLLVTFDLQYRLRDLYFPHVGRHNHADGRVQRFGVWADGRFAWTDAPSWRRDIRYKPDTLITEVTLVSDELGLELVCNDAVDAHEPVLLRRCLVRNLTPRHRDVRLFFHLDLSINGYPVGDTANYDPSTSSVVFYKDDSYFLVSTADARRCGVDHWAIGTKRLGGAEGTWRDAEDGSLGRNAISQGSVDATVGVNLALDPNAEAPVWNWVACGRSYKDVKNLNRMVWALGPDTLLARTETYWRLWARKEQLDFSPLPQGVRDLYYRSLLVIRTQIDNRGAILAANDSDATQFGGDHYSYCWPRDGALVAHALILAGQSELSRNFFRFCARVAEDDGYFLHKYTPTGDLGSSWHPWMVEGKRVLPVQQDETALVLWALRRHFEAFKDVEFVKPLYPTLVVRAAEWMLDHRDDHGLPLPSWDLWEERRGVHTFTVAATIGALQAAAAFARDFGEHDRASSYLDRAERMTTALKRHLYHPEAGRFARMAIPAEPGAPAPYRLDMKHDSANYGLFAFGAFDPRDPLVEGEMRALRERLWVRTDVGGCARYEHDYYHQIERHDLAGVPGNPWVICTLWHAQHAIARARTLDDLRPAMEDLDWTVRRALPSGALAEQFNPHTGEPVSVSPLTWSHATVVIVVAQYLRRHEELRRRARTHAAAHALAPLP